MYNNSKTGTVQFYRGASFVVCLLGKMDIKFILNVFFILNTQEHCPRYREVRNFEVYLMQEEAGMWFFVRRICDGNGKS